ncbi:unnamed protein product [Cylindrotheca closterium]|uniref:Cyclin N-terminal domain-containing protein n=1 Tax=Cylindrotheca closterium TaxID=2856 RepID=A0AAD2FYV4_9STRA|nr:unnamed protein product [Cylindrotheca closterium]
MSMSTIAMENSFIPQPPNNNTVPCDDDDFLLSRTPQILNNFEPQVPQSFSMRQLLGSKAEWCYAAADLFDLKHSTAEIAVTLLSRYMMNVMMTRRTNDQCQVNSPDQELPSDQVCHCSGAASLIIAMRVNNETRSSLSLEDLLRMTEYRCTEEEILQTERNILQVLDHCIQSPTTEMFATHFVKFLELKYNISLRHFRQTTLQPLLRVSIQHLLFLEFPTEFVALAVVLLALDLYCDTSEKERLYLGLYAAAGVTKGSAKDHAVRALSDELLEIYHKSLTPY